MGMMDKAMVTMEEALQLHPSHVTAEGERAASQI